MSWLRRKLGRELSPEDIDKAKRDVVEERLMQDMEYFIVNGLPVVRETRYKWVRTPDMSWGTLVMHEGKYEYFCRARVYNEDGLLIMEEKEKGHPIYPVGSLVIKKFNPSGSLFGKRVPMQETDVDYLHFPNKSFLSLHEKHAQ